MVFIKEYRNAFTPDFCQDVIKVFDECNSLGITGVVKRDDIGRKDKQLELSPVEFISPSTEIDLTASGVSSVFFDTVIEHAKKYIKDFIMAGIGDLNARNMLVQKNDADTFGAYHGWHSENMTRNTSERNITYVVYLNDDFEGGETEFLYQKLKCKPEVGKLVLFPASYTHTHRGGLLLSGTKYIITGWFFHA
jgi:Rps23 Pro-64 3,4-dihydroxylase Tpa1-like proline 4-hydroxylase